MVCQLSYDVDMNGKRLAIQITVAVVLLVALGFGVIQYNGGLDNPNLVCDIAIRSGDC